MQRLNGFRVRRNDLEQRPGGPSGRRALLLPVLQRAQVYSNQFREPALADLGRLADGAHVRRRQFGNSYAAHAFEQLVEMLIIHS